MTEPQSMEDVKGMMQVLLDRAKKTRESYGYSGDEKMLPMAFIFGNEITVIMLDWKDNDEKYAMAKMVNREARNRGAKSLSFITDARWVDGEKFAEFFKLEAVDEEKFRRDYERILRAVGGVKNLPRQLWDEAVVVFTNGPGIPATVQMAPYVAGENDTILWLPPTPHTVYKSEMLLEWWK
jgi:hypothetical protein